MQGKEYIFAIQDKDFNFYAPGGRISTAPYFLQFSPNGWEDIEIQNVRNKKYWGIDRTVSVPLSFVKDGADILRECFYTKGIQSGLYLVIAAQKLVYNPPLGTDPGSYGFWYKQVFRSEIDMSTFNHDGVKVTVTTLEDGFAKHLKANENTEYEIKLNVPEAIDVTMDGIILHNEVENIVTNGMNISDANFDKGNHTLDIKIVKEDAEYVKGKREVDRIRYGNNNTDLFNSQEYFLPSTVAGTLVVEFNFKVKLSFNYSAASLNPAAAYRIQVLQLDQSGALISATALLDIPASAGLNRFNNTIYNVSGSFNVNLVAGSFLYLHAFCTVSGSTGADNLTTTYLDGENSFFKYSYLYRHRTTTVKALRMQYIFDRLIELMSESKFTSELSNYFDFNKDILITSGSGLRGFADPSLKIKFADFFKFNDSFDAVGLTETGKTIGLERKEALTDPNNYIILNEPTNLKISVAKEFLNNELNIGYPEIGTDVGIMNGLEETNTKFNFSLGTTNSPAALDKISPLIASCYEIEKVRVAAMESSTTDTNMDNKNYLLATEYVPEQTINIPLIGIRVIPAYTRLDRRLNSTATGVLEKDTVFNIPLSPGRMIRNNESYLRSLQFTGAGQVYKFISSEKNNKMVAGGIVEKADRPVLSFAPNFFTPIQFQFDIEAPDNLEDILEVSPTKLFKLPFRGQVYTLLPFKVSISPSSNKVQSYTMISHSSNDLTKLIDYYGQ